MFYHKWKGDVKMEDKKISCPVCGHDVIKTGRLNPPAYIVEMNSIVNLKRSEVHVTFCAKCGEIISMKVAEPYKF